MLVKLSCQRCGKEFEARRKDAKYCPSCRPMVHKTYEVNYERRHPARCVDCGKPIIRRSTRCHLCDNKSRVDSNLGENNPSWKGGRTRNNGYIYILAKREGKKHRYQGEHIVVWEQANKKSLPKGWLIHHFNGIRDDNRIGNLVAMPRKRHNLKLAFEPYEKRIRQLEAELTKLAPIKQLSERFGCVIKTK